MRRNAILAVLLVCLSAGGLVQAFSGMERGGLFHAFGDPYPRIVHQVFSHVEKKYVEPERAQPRKLLEGALQALENQYPAVLVDLDEAGSQARVQVDEAVKTFDLAGTDRFTRAADVLNTVLEFVDANLGGEVEEKDLYYAAINGALADLDPHSTAFSPKSFKEFMIGTRGTFGGIGFVFGIRDGDMTIITPIEGTPADRGGLRSGDKILFIDGEPTINMAVDVAANKMRGEPGTKVTLTLTREGWTEPKAITFTREVIHVDSVESYVLDGDGEAPVIYAKVKNFQKDTTDELRKAVREAEAAHPGVKGVVLDLRNDPGGLLEQAIALSDAFLDRGTIVATRGPEGDANSRAVARDTDAQISRRPLILLINQGSASASEIVAGALKASRALTVGQKTFGKGSVQKLYPLTDGGALKLTVAQYLTPGDVSIQSIGIEPDVAVYPARVERGRMRLGPPPSHVEESTLKNAFNEWGNYREKPWAAVQYLEPTDEEEEPRRSFAELDHAEKLARLAEDFEVRLARRVLARVDAPEGAIASRDALKAAASAVLPRVREEEDAKISRQLAGLGVDWSAGRGTEVADLAVEVSPEARLKAGTDAKLVLSVVNHGSADVWQLWGRTDSDNPLLKNLDAPFGHLAPGERRSWTVEIEVPKSAPDRWDQVRLRLSAGSAEGAEAPAGAARTVAIPAPEFVYTYTLADENPADAKHSGDGVLSEGERARLTLRVRNRGDGASDAAEVNIRAEEEEELYLEAARDKLETLAPGQVREAPMTFRVVKADEDGKVRVGVVISDRDFAAFLGDQLTFVTDTAYQPAGARIPPTFRLASPPPLSTTDEKLELTVVAADDEALKDFFAYRGENKIRYERNRGGGKELTVRLEVPLEEGSNRLVLAARDDQEMQGNRTFFVFRRKAAEAPAPLGMK